MIIMHTEREIKIITTVFISVLLITNTVLTAVIKEPLLACLIASLALVILYISAVVMVKRIYARIAGVRTAAKELSIRKSANNESEGLSAIKQEMLTEGEFGKLSGAIYDMYTGILEAADREKEQKLYLKDMISDMSHQLKTPIASLTLFTDILSSHATSQDWGEEEIDILRREEGQLERMRWLTLSLLQLARLEINSVEFKKIKTPVLMLLQNAAAELLPMAEQRGVNIVVEDAFEYLKDDVEQNTTNTMVSGVEQNEAHIEENTRRDNIAAEIEADPEWMHEALSNIVKNAIEHSPEGGTVTLGCTRTPLMIKLTVTDTGRGIPEADRLKVFERFSHSSDAASVNPDSVGIGLPLSKNIIEENGGRIYIESRFIDECKASEKSYTTVNIIFNNTMR
ncbi:Signal transduction histidine kinase [Eubacterium ruminantium]|uniref:histidine kinase n=2 Tax=Eubacterium ruminantium TaxID=42322 RepID=A0A1T4KSJ9_9FIRM|nr:Signal transduction histidine kinase [Eubacterium ruminantium]SDM33027.1 Signal transduction histidine kinase [Eubacterium ruminantium]SJZ45415.1 Signal transduction histidine kinase [Eubacterium ruminantium]